MGSFTKLAAYAFILNWIVFYAVFYGLTYLVVTVIASLVLEKYYAMIPLILFLGLYYFFLIAIVQLLLMRTLAKRMKLHIAWNWRLNTIIVASFLLFHYTTFYILTPAVLGDIRYDFLSLEMLKQIGVFFILFVGLIFLIFDSGFLRKLHKNR